MKESAGTYALPTLCLTGPASRFLSLFLTRLQHPMSPWPPPPLAGFTGHGKDVCVLGMVVTSEHSADVIPPSGHARQPLRPGHRHSSGHVQAGELGARPSW
jgi:hypothetical protein